MELNFRVMYRVVRDRCLGELLQFFVLAVRDPELYQEFGDGPVKVRSIKEVPLVQFHGTIYGRYIV